MDRGISVSVNIWKARKGISLRELESMTDIPRATLSRIENNQKSPTLKQLELISIATGINIVNLLDL